MDLTTRSTSGPAEPRPAATVVLLRPGPHGPEALLTTRPSSMRFMGGAVVFPGGALAAADLDPRWEAASRRNRAEAARALGTHDEAAALGAFVCAVREAFEEVGFVVGDGPVDRLRREDADDPARFLERCLALGVRLGTDELVPVGRWITPPGSPLRYDARFFLAATDPSWIPDADVREVAECRWATPSQALDDLAAGRAVMAPPTIVMLQRLAPASSVADALASAPRLDDALLSVRLSRFVHLVLAPNPGLMTGPGTNTYVVGRPPCAVIDPAVDDPAYLAAVLEVAEGAVGAILVTHRHQDHTEGVAALAALSGASVHAFGDAAAGGTPVEPLADGDLVRAGGVSLLSLHTPGHAADHLCFLVEGTTDLFSGDTILGEGTAVVAPPDGNMRAYLETLRRLDAIGLGHVYPGHFRMLDDGAAVVRSYLRHREARARAILDALAPGPATVEEIVARVYVDTPAVLHPVAAYSVRAHLAMAEEQGLVCRAGDDRWSRI